MGADLTDLFNLLTGYSRQREYRKLLVAPVTMRPGLVGADPARGRSEADGAIVLKMNSLVDADMIDALYEASQAGVRIDLLVRGICCLRPGVPGLSEHIRARSIVGRFLEHSRIYRFGSTERGRDLPDRLRRPDAAQPRPARRGAHAGRGARAAGAHRRDPRRRVWTTTSLPGSWAPTGAWRKVPTTVGVNAQRRLQELAVSRAEGDR